MRVGILALQGGFAAHARRLAALGHEARLVRAAADLAGAEGLVLPGGESTTLLTVLDPALRAAIVEHARAGRPVLATCAGLILIARRVTGPEQPSLALLDVEVARNAWGRQVASFEARADGGDLPLTFIRAPRIVDAGRAEVLVTCRDEPVLVREGAMVGATFHPELTADPRVHEMAFGRPAPLYSTSSSA